VTGAARGGIRLGRVLGAVALVGLPLGVFALSGPASGGPVAQTSPAAQTSPSPRTPLARAGQGLYEERCATCHGSGGNGTDQGPAILGLGPAAYDFMMSTGRMPLAQSISCPGCSSDQFLQKIQSHRRRPVLTPDEIRSITAFLVSLDPTGVQIPTVDIADGNLSDGEATYQANCAPCHGTTGNGGAVGPQVAPDLHHATVTQIGEAVRFGPGTMPVFDPSTVDQRALNSLTRYVVYLRHPEDRGGASLNHVGPLIEGLVGIVLGLGLTVVVTRYIGTRS
jgi:ubiquinol-cytochrome c reductase cytochrome c subunit